MPFGEKRPDERVFRQLVPLSRPVCRADWRKTPGFSPTAPEFTAETDSPLEGDGFEPAVPLKRHRFRATAPGLPPACRPSARNMATASLSLPFSKAGIVLVCY